MYIVFKIHLVAQLWSVHLNLYASSPTLKSLRLVDSDILNLNPSFPLTNYEPLDK